jgi:competence protein ComEC
VTDAQPPVVRATVMVLVGCGAVWLGRPALSFNSLAVAALAVLAINPADLFAVGPQLSFLAVAALAWRKHAAPVAPPDPLDRLIERSQPWPRRALNRAARDSRRALVESLLVCGVVTPLLVAQFHLLSASAVVLGPLLALPVAVGMASGFVLLATGAWLPPIAMLSATICESCLSFVERSVEWGQRIPGGHMWLPGPSGWWLTGFYAGLAAWAIFGLRWSTLGSPLRSSLGSSLTSPLRLPSSSVAGIGAPSRRPLRWAVALFCAWLSIGLGVGWAERHWQPRALRCTNLSVGHGTAVVLELPDGRTSLYDAGRLGSPQAASDAVAGYLWSRGITHLDAAVLSHADADHYNALPGTVRSDPHTRP